MHCVGLIKGLDISVVICIVLYCFIIMLCTAFDFGDCSIDVCLFVLYCVVCFVCVLCVFSDKFHVQLLYDRVCEPRK